VQAQRASGWPTAAYGQGGALARRLDEPVMGRDCADLGPAVWNSQMRTLYKQSFRYWTERAAVWHS